MTITSWLLPWTWVLVQEDACTPRRATSAASRNSKLRRLVAVIVGCRSLYLTAMALSCHFVPEHNPGDDVLRFDMRLAANSTSFDCFCLKDHVCASFATRGGDFSTRSPSPSDCAIPSSAEAPWIPHRVWHFALSPLTKWDAARFLSLAVQPSLRDPSSFDESSWDESEQAHAFLPVFPWILQQLAWMAMAVFPARRLPPTFEGLVVLCGLVWNNVICLVVSVLALYHLTYQAVVVVPATRDGTPTQRSFQQCAHNVAAAVCLVYGIWNPASVFFATNYSESLFATVTLLGHVCMQRWNTRASDRAVTATMIDSVWWCGAMIFWMIGSYTRSNGTLQCLWLFQDGLARILDQYQRPEQRKQDQSRLGVGATFQAFLISLQTVIGVFLVALPVRYHDWRGYQRHCVGRTVKPSWCSSNGGEQHDTFYAYFFGSSFSLYRHIQDKHWNVGLFRYIQWKQLPNFLLAAPILGLSFAGAFQWLRWSLIADYGRGKLPSLSPWRTLLWRWPMYALAESVEGPNPRSSNNITTKHTRDESARSMTTSRLVENPRLLGHYAILSILAVIGLVLAHVQISTRMVCSSSPAALWFLTYCMIQKPPLQAAKRGHEDTMNVGHGTHISPPSRLGLFVWLYTGLFMVLGVLLHVNFLPWT